MGSISQASGFFKVKKICIIGAGPTSLAVAKYLLAEKSFDRIDIFEQQAELGGVWHYAPPISEHVHVPQTKPTTVADEPLWSRDGGPPIFSNPMYEKLNTNIPKDLMKYSDLEFPADSLLFPSRQDVQQYLLDYAREIRNLISFSTQVQNITYFSRNGMDQWNVLFKSFISQETHLRCYDAVVVASGHYSVPFIPEVKNIEVFDKLHPTIISHSKTYRSAASFRGKKVVVVGSGPSGLDIGTQISQVCLKPLLNSVRTPSSAKFGPENKEEVSPIAEYLPYKRGVRFEGGREEVGIDAIVYCTGYLYSFPFFKGLEPPIVSDGRRARGLYQQLFNITYPSIAFTALPQRIIPFPLSEAQGAAIAKVWSNKLKLPPAEEMYALERKQVDELGDGTTFHLLPYPKDARYINELYEWVSTAQGGFSKIPSYWGEKECWIRENFGAMRKAFVDGGGKATSMEELGFRFGDSITTSSELRADARRDLSHPHHRP